MSSMTSLCNFELLYNSRCCLQGTLCLWNITFLVVRMETCERADIRLCASAGSCLNIAFGMFVSPVLVVLFLFLDHTFSEVTTV